MGAIVVVLLLALVLSAAVMLYVAYPYRGEETPLTPAVGRAMRRGVEALPTVDTEAQAAASSSPHRTRADAHR